MAKRMHSLIVPETDELDRRHMLTQMLSVSAGNKPRLVDPDEETIGIPDSIYKVLLQATEAMSRGLAVMIVPIDQELTTQQAANLLNVSRQYLEQMLDEGHIPFYQVGHQRRIHLVDLLEFQEARKRCQREPLRQLTRLSEELGMYDPDFPTKLSDA